MDVTIAGSATGFTPDDDDLAVISVEFAAFDGEVGYGSWPIPDPAAAVSVLDGRRFLIREIDTVVSDGFIIDQDRDRGHEKASTARLHTFSVADANALLDGFRVVRSRPAETDVARVLAFAALDIPSADTTWVINSATVTMPKKKYASDGGWTSELIPDLVDYTGKTLFLHDKAGGGRCLHYHVLTSGHTCGLTITDVPSALNATHYAPGNPHRSRTSVDLRNDVKGYDQAGRTSHVTDATSIGNHDADGLQHQAYVAFETISQSDLNVKTAAFLASNKLERDTWTCTIGPLDATALALIRVGDLITVTSSVMGLTASAQRIAHMTGRVFSGKEGVYIPGLWDLELELGAPIRRRRRGKKVQAPPPVPDTGEDSPGGASCEFDFPVLVTPELDLLNFAGPGAALPVLEGYTMDVGTILESGQAMRNASGGPPATYYGSNRTVATYDLPAGTTYVRIRGTLTGQPWAVGATETHTGPSTYSSVYRLSATVWDRVDPEVGWEPTGSTLATATITTPIRDTVEVSDDIDIIMSASEGDFQLHLSDVSSAGAVRITGTPPNYVIETFTADGSGTRDVTSGVFSTLGLQVFAGTGGGFSGEVGFSPFEAHYVEPTGSITGGGSLTVHTPEGATGVDVSALAHYAFPAGPVEVLANVSLPGGAQAVALEIGFFDAAGELYGISRSSGPGGVIAMDGGDAVSVATSEGGATDAVGVDADDTVWLRIAYSAGGVQATVWPSTGSEAANGTTVGGSPTPIGDVIGVYVNGHANGTGTDGIFIVNSLMITIGCQSFEQAFGGIMYGPVLVGYGDGTTVDFSIPTDFIAGTLSVKVNGVELEPTQYNADHDTRIVTLVVPPLAGATVTVTYVPPI